MGEMVEFPGADGRRPRKPLWRNVLGEVLRGERLEQERILTEVAATAGVSPQYLSEVERGRKEASSEVLGAVADALGLELADVVGRIAGRLAARAPERVEHRTPRRVDEQRRTAPIPPAVPNAETAPTAPAVPGRPAGSAVDVFLLAA